MYFMINIIKKQLQLLEIELGDYQIARNQGLTPPNPEEYYAGLAHAYKGLKFAILALEKVELKENKNEQH